MLRRSSTDFYIVENSSRTLGGRIFITCLQKLSLALFIIFEPRQMQNLYDNIQTEA